MKTNYGCTEKLAIDLLEDLTVYLAGPNVVAQKEYIDGKATDKIIGYQIWCATDEDNPFKIKFATKDKPDISGYKIGEKLIFDGLEAIQVQNKYYFRAKSVNKL